MASATRAERLGARRIFIRRIAGLLSTSIHSTIFPLLKSNDRWNWLSLYFSCASASRELLFAARFRTKIMVVVVARLYPHRVRQPPNAAPGGDGGLVIAFRLGKKLGDRDP